MPYCLTSKSTAESSVRFGLVDVILIILPPLRTNIEAGKRGVSATMHANTNERDRNFQFRLQKLPSLFD